MHGKGIKRPGEWLRKKKIPLMGLEQLDCRVKSGGSTSKKIKRKRNLLICI